MMARLTLEISQIGKNAPLDVCNVMEQPSFKSKLHVFSSQNLIHMFLSIDLLQKLLEGCQNHLLIFIPNLNVFGLSSPLIVTKCLYKCKLRTEPSLCKFTKKIFFSYGWGGLLMILSRSSKGG